MFPDFFIGKQPFRVFGIISIFLLTQTMEKISLLFAFLAISACSSDDSANLIENDGVLLQSMTRTSGENETIISFEYEGFNIKKRIEADEETRYEYTGSEITSIKYYSVNEDLIEDWILAYSDGVLTQATKWEGALLGTTTYVFEYPDANTITCVGHTVYPDQPGNSYETNYVYTKNAQGEITSILTSSGNGPGILQTLTYDDKHNPMRNVIGFAKLLPLQIGGFKHNIVQSNESTVQYLSTYEYNTNEYPEVRTVTATGNVEPGEPIITHYFYE